MQYKLAERECVPFELSKEEYEACIELVKKMRMKEFSNALDKAVRVLGADVVVEKMKQLIL